MRTQEKRREVRELAWSPHQMGRSYMVSGAPGLGHVLVKASGFMIELVNTQRETNKKT